MPGDDDPITFHYVDDDEVRALEVRVARLADVVVVRIDLDVVLIDACSECGACER
jgi:hypothetical protein